MSRCHQTKVLSDRRRQKQNKKKQQKKLPHLETLSGEQAEMLVSMLSELSTLSVSKARRYLGNQRSLGRRWFVRMRGHRDHSTAFGAPRQCAADCALRNMPTNQRKHEFSNNEQYEITPHDSSFLFSGLSQLYLRVQHHSQKQILHSCCLAQCPLAMHCPGHPGALDCAHKDQPPCNNILTTHPTFQKFGVRLKNK